MSGSDRPKDWKVRVGESEGESGTGDKDGDGDGDGDGTVADVGIEPFLSVTGYSKRSVEEDR
jgi:hypothetical protein